MFFHWAKTNVYSSSTLVQSNFQLVFQLTFARFYLPVFLPEAERAIYLDDDVVVQGKTE